MHVGLRWVPDNLRARVTSLIFMCASLGTVVGMAATPALASCIGWQVRAHPPTTLVTERHHAPIGLHTCVMSLRRLCGESLTPSTFFHTQSTSNF